MLDCIDYHRLFWASEITGCTENTLIQLAIDDQLDIYTELPNGFKALRVDTNGLIVDIKEKKVTGSRMVKIPTSALREFLVNNQACILVFKSYDEPDIFFQSSDQLRIDKFSLVFMKDDLNRLSESFAAQRAIIYPNIDVPKRADLIDLVSLSKVIARRYNMTNAEACLWVSNQIEPENTLYDISGFTLPKRIHELKTWCAPSECFNQYWWEHPKNESKPIRSLDGISANGIAISKADAEKFCLIPISELNELATEKLPLSADALGVVIRANVIDLVSLSKAVAKHTNMTSMEACEWITGDIIRKQLLVYSLRSIAFPKLIESRDGMIISGLFYELWAEYPDTDGFEIDDFDLKANQIAISKVDAEKYFSIPISKLDGLTKEKLSLDTDTFDVVTKAKCIDLVSLSKAVTKHRNMTNGEACDWVTTKIQSVEAFYDTSGYTLPERIPDDKAVDAACECFNQNWWIKPENEDTPILYYGLSAKEIAISKADAEKYCFIPKSELEELPTEKLPLSTNILDVVTRASLIDLVSLPKAIASHHKMTIPEACDFVLQKIIPEGVPVYNLTGSCLPEQFSESKAADALCSSVNSDWWINPKDEDTPMIGMHGVSANEVGISKVDAEKYLSIPIGVLEESLPEKQPLYTEDTTVINEFSQIKNGAKEAEKLSHLSENLIILNEAASIFCGVSTLFRTQG